MRPGSPKPLRFAAIHTDGVVLRCYRWSSDCRAPSLYWRQTEGGAVVASEPFDSEMWESVPAGSVLTLDEQGGSRIDAIEVAVPALA